MLGGENAGETSEAGKVGECWVEWDGGSRQRDFTQDVQGRPETVMCEQRPGRVRE